MLLYSCLKFQWYLMFLSSDISHSFLPQEQAAYYANSKRDERDKSQNAEDNQVALLTRRSCYYCSFNSWTFGCVFAGHFNKIVIPIFLVVIRTPVLGSIAVVVFFLFFDSAVIITQFIEARKSIVVVKLDCVSASNSVLKSTEIFCSVI